MKGDVAHRQGFSTLKWAILPPTPWAARQFRLTALKIPHWGRPNRSFLPCEIKIVELHSRIPN